MKVKTKLYGLAAMTVLAALVLYSCSKEDSGSNNVPPGQQHVTLYLTDDPAYFDKVMVDIRSVKVLVDTCTKPNSRDDDDDDDDGRGHGNGHHDDDDDRDDTCISWQTLNITPGVYDLLTLRNGTDTLLANGLIPKGKIKKIKIELGNNNSLVKDSVTYPLKLFPGIGSTVIIKVKGGDWDEYSPDRFRLWLDFDVTRSVIRVRDGQFYLKPVIVLFTVKATGSIEGRVLPREAYPVISVYNAQDTGYAIPWGNGQYKVRGLKEGAYKVFVNASNGYQDTTINDVQVRRGRETKLPTITLHK